MKRRQFIKIGGFILTSSLILRDSRGIYARGYIENKYPDIVYVDGGFPFDRVATAINEFGGIRRFIKPNSTVVIKPNAAFAQSPEMGGNTTPEIIEAVIKLCKKANPKSITIVEHCLSNHGKFGTSNDPSGISQVAQKEGVSIFDAGNDPIHYKTMQLNAPSGKYHGFIRKFLEADVVINIPRAKTHPWAGYTLSIKNLMGTMQTPKLFHSERQMNWLQSHLIKALRRTGIKKGKIGWKAFPANLVALAKFMEDCITLNIVDMTDLVKDWSADRSGKLEPLNAIIVGQNFVNVDAYAISLFGGDPLGPWVHSASGNYIRVMHDAGLGSGNIKSLNISKIRL